MWRADAAAAETVSVPLGARKKAGRLLRSRPHSTKFNDKAAAPIGLLRNCYVGNWLASLPPRIVQCLRVVDKDYGFGTSDPDPSAPPGPASTTGPVPPNPSVQTAPNHSQVPAEANPDSNQPPPVS